MLGGEFRSAFYAELCLLIVLKATHFAQPLFSRDHGSGCRSRCGLLCRWWRSHRPLQRWWDSGEVNDLVQKNHISHADHVAAGYREFLLVVVHNG